MTCSLWINPEPGQYDLNYTLALTKRMHAKSYHIYLDYHYSDYWAPWHTMGLTAAVRDYTLQAL